jgi:hypothetical protein
METRKKLNQGTLRAGEKPFGIFPAMKNRLFWSFLLCLIPASQACRFQNPYPDAPGVLFIRQQICDLGDFKKGFFRPENSLKARGFLAYSFHRDLRDPGAYILAFKCADLRKAVEFIQSSNFITACVGAGRGLPLMWGGVGEKGDPGQNFAQTPGGLVVARYEVRDYGSWKKAWDAGKNGNPGLPGGGKITGIGCRYRLAGSPGVVIVAREVADIIQAPDFMASREVKNAMEAAGVLRQDLWFGTNLEEGTF